MRPAYGLHAAIAIFVLAGLLLYYGLFSSLHQDLAGSALSGRLAAALGESFDAYGIYFPPAERLWFSLAAHLSDLTGLRLDLVVVLMTGGAVLFGTGLAYRIRQVTVGASPRFLLVSLAALVIVPILFKNVFGLREHLVAAGLWPYLVMRLSDPDGSRIGRPLRLMVGLWLGPALLFKYAYCVVVVLVELADSFVQRRPSLLFRIENIVAGGAVALYLFLWLGIDPAQRAAMGAMYSAIDANLAEPGDSWRRVAENLVLAVALLFASWKFNVPQRAVALALATVAGAVIAAWSQGRWYTHHLFPITLAYCMWWWLAAHRLRWSFNVAVALFLLIPVGKQYQSLREYREPLAELEQALDRSGLSVAGKRVALLNMHPSPYNQYLTAKGALRWTPMMNNAYVAAELKEFDQPQNAGKLLPPITLANPGRRMLHDQMLRLWQDMPPDVLILDRSTRWPLRHVDVDWQQAFAGDPRFKAFLFRYRPVLVHNGAKIRFTYYVRAR